MNRLQCRTEQQRRFIIIGGPSGFAVDALPTHLELRVNQDDRLRTAASGTHDAVFVEDLAEDETSLHTQGVGSLEAGR